KKTAKQQLGLISNMTLIFGCGTLDWRKAPDLFVDVAENLLKRGLTDIHFYWIGWAPIDYPNLITDLSDRGLDNHVTFLGEKKNPIEYLATGDIFLLTSREDPFPLVCLESADCGLPTVCFENAGGMPAFVAEAKGGFIVPYEDVAAMTDKVARLIENPKLREQFGCNARDALHKGHTTNVSAPKILKIIHSIAGTKPAVSIIVPAYNHARFLRKRLDSIFQQTFRDFEVILLDDASTDETSAILKEYQHKFDTILDINKKNSGSTFSQWTKGIKKANADLVWIAEDDDLCEQDFLEKLLPSFDDPEVNLVYSQSYAIDDNDTILFSYKNYTNEISRDRWGNSYKVHSNDEVNTGLGTKNTIPNASAVLFRRFDIGKWESEWSTRELAGDWAFYLHAICDGKIAYNPEHLNYHRRHSDTNIFRTQYKESRFREIVAVHKWTLEAYDVSDETKIMMKEHANEIWFAVFPNKNNSDFENAYSITTKL
ncbi:glycosyltransferase, partial [Pseudomonadota bacterium]